MNEKKLAKALKSGGSRALGEIMDAYSGYVAAAARGFSRGALTEDDIDEVIVDVFYNLWRYRENIDEDMGLRAYLSAAARNTVINRFRKAVPIAEDISELDIPSDFLTEEAAELSEMMRCLKSGLTELSPDEREAFFRYYFNGESTSLIAEKTHTAESTVRTRLRRARGKLKDFLAERGFYNV